MNMACMTHICRDCGHEWFDNYADAICCEKCGSEHVSNPSDEDEDEE